MVTVTPRLDSVSERNAVHHERWLVIVEEALLPTDSGARTETLGLLQACESQNITCRIWVLGPCDRPRHQQAFPDCPIEFLPRRTTWMAALSPRPYVIASRPFSRAIAARVLPSLQAWGATAVVSSTFRVSHIGLAVARQLGIPLLVRPHNLESDYFEKLARSSRGLRRLAYKMEAVKLRRFEQSMHRSPEVAAFADLSDEEAGRRQLLSTQPVFHLSPFLPAVRVLPDTGRTSSADVMFLGSLDNPNNVDGLRWLVGQVWPRVRAVHPEQRLRVVGRNPPSSIVRLLNETPNAITMWDLPEIDEAFAETAVFVNPVRRGAGVNIKVVEAAARGVAITSTSVGLRGLNFVADTDALVADHPAGFADAIIRLLRNSELRTRLGAAARARVTSAMDHALLIDRMNEMLAPARPRGSAEIPARVGVSQAVGPTPSIGCGPRVGEM